MFCNRRWQSASFLIHYILTNYLYVYKHLVCLGVIALLLQSTSIHAHLAVCCIVKLVTCVTMLYVLSGCCILFLVVLQVKFVVFVIFMFQFIITFSAHQFIVKNTTQTLTRFQLNSCISLINVLQPYQNSRINTL